MMQSHFLLPFHYALCGVAAIAKGIVGVLLVPWTGPVVDLDDIPFKGVFGFMLAWLLLIAITHIVLDKVPHPAWVSFAVAIASVWIIAFFGRFYKEVREEVERERAKKRELQEHLKSLAQEILEKRFLGDEVKEDEQ